MRIVLISTYELGRQPFGLASPAAWLRRAGWDVTCVDLTRQPLPASSVATASLIGFHLPMHTATRLAASAIATVRRLGPSARICAYGLYAPLNAAWLRSIGVDEVLGGEFEEELTAIALGCDAGPASERARRPELPAALPRIHFLVPDRSGLPALDRYATLHMPDGTTAPGRLDRGQPGLQAPVPTLSDRPRLRRTVPHRGARRRARRYRRAGRRGSAAHHVWRSGFLQRPHARDAHRRWRCTPRIPR